MIWRHSAMAVALGLFAVEDIAWGHPVRATISGSFALANAAIALWTWRHP